MSYQDIESIPKPVETIEQSLTPLLDVVQREKLKKEYHELHDEVEKLKMLRFIINAEIKWRQEMLGENN